MVAFFRLVAGRIILHWDILAFDHPRCLFMSDIFRANMIPLWNPFQDCGTAFFSDPLNGMWYPVSHLIIWTTGYSLAAIEFEYLLHLFIAGCGTLWLARRMGLSHIAGAGAATAYMLSGIFIGHAQHLQVVISFAWLPFMMAAAEGMAREKLLRYPVIYALAVAMQILGGYPALAMISVLFSGIYFIVCLWQDDAKEKNMKGSMIRIAAFSNALILGLGVSSVLLVPVFSDLPLYSDRLGEFEYELALDNEALPVSSLVSLIIPAFSTLGVPGERPFGSDPSMLTMYFGILSLLLSVFTLFKARHKRLWPWAAMGVAALLLAFGGRGILRALSIEFIPLFDSFRHSALFRCMFVLAFSLLAGIGIEHLIQEQSESKKSFGRALAVSLVVLVLFLVISAALFLIYYDIDISKAIPLRDIFLGQIPLAILILFLAYISLVRIKRPGMLGMTLIAIIGLDGALMVQTLNPLLGEPLKPELKSYLEAVQNNRSRSFPDRPRIRREDTFGMYEMSGMARKVFQTGNYNTFRLRKYIKVSDRGFHKIAAGEPRFYLSPRVSYITDEKSALDLIQRTSENIGFPALVFDPPPASIEIDQNLVISPDIAAQSRIAIIEYSINSIKLQAFNRHPALLASTESFNPGWSVLVDGEEAELVRVNLAFRGVYLLTPGRHQVIFKFQPRSFKLGTALSIISLVAGLCIFIGTAIQRRRDALKES